MKRQTSFVFALAWLLGQSHAAADFSREILPVLQEFCFNCHSAEKAKGDFNLERFSNLEAAKSDPKAWQSVQEQLVLGEMPPKDKPQPSPEKKALLLNWVGETLSEIARAQAGDPGPVVLRRLSNAEYSYTLRDITGVPSLDPAREFPADGAAGEGFSNVGAALVMSPATLGKYLEAARTVAAHAMPLPDGIRFAAGPSSRDWTDTKLAEIRAFYSRFTIPGGGTAVNLQGIRFDTRDGGILPLTKYLEATIAEREVLANGTRIVDDIAAARSLNPKYLRLLWTAMQDENSSILIKSIREQWKSSKVSDVPDLANAILAWQQALWRFTTVGHIGKRDGPKAWQEPVEPLVASRNLEQPFPATENKTRTLHVNITDAGDSNAGDEAWIENPRIVVPGHPDLPLRDLDQRLAWMTQFRDTAIQGAVPCLAAAAEFLDSPVPESIDSLASRHRVNPSHLGAWLSGLGMGTGPSDLGPPLTNPLRKVESYDFIHGWTGADALSVLANSSDQSVRIPGTMKPHGVAVHPAPNRRVIIGWRSPVEGSVEIGGTLQHAHPECGNGVTWTLEVRRGQVRQRLASGNVQGNKPISLPSTNSIRILPGNVVTLSIGPRDGNHSCDLTAVDLWIRHTAGEWNLASDVSPDILASNPHPDRRGNSNVWHFTSEPDSSRGELLSSIPDGSLMARWMRSTDGNERSLIAREFAAALSQPISAKPGTPDEKLVAHWRSLSGPLAAPAWTSPAPGGIVPGTSNPNGLAVRLNSGPAVFSTDAANRLATRPPAVLGVELPPDFGSQAVFHASVRLPPDADPEASIQVQITEQMPTRTTSLVAGTLKESGTKGTWSDGERPAVSSSPVLVAPGRAAEKRFRKAFDDFRDLFPAALCYTKIVPVDEVVTLTLFYREDSALQRLMLDESGIAELNRHWNELEFVSQYPVRQVDAFDQLWQFATQDADPSAFTPMGPVIRKKAEEFKARVKAAEPAQVKAAIEFARKAWRRPITDPERADLAGLYAKLRAEDLPHDAALRTLISRILVAPAFLFKSERPADSQTPAPVGDHELATRLSYFLWASAPDEELSVLADQHELRKPNVLRAQVGRMLRDERIRRLAVEFGTQWLHTRDFDRTDEKSERHFPTFAAVRNALNEEPIQFFSDFFGHRRSILSLLDSDHTFLNEKLAAHYGVPGVTGEQWRRVDGMRAAGRGGILGLGAVLAKQSGASRTSPILRGNWLSETLLGERLPRPPKDVPVLPEEAPQGLTERQLTERHSNDPKCTGCHLRIDPFGFALEGFDAIGRLRETDTAGLKVDVHTRLMNGKEVHGLPGLRDYLLNEKNGAFLRQFLRKLLGYSLGRSVQLSDQPLLDQMIRDLPTQGYSVGSAIETIVASPQFREIRGKRQITDL